MKKRYLYVIGAKKWNSLLVKFTKLQKRLHLSANNDSTQYSKLVSKLKSVYAKLEKMQYQTGIKVAGTSLAIALSTFTANAQFAAGQLLQVGGADIDVGSSAVPTFADIDGDGDLDLYVGQNSGYIKFFTNTNGVYTAGANIQSGVGDIEVYLGYSTPTFADLDNDGDLDLYVGEYYGEINVYLNNNGVFTAVLDLKADGVTIDAGMNPHPTFADLDSDGDLDLYLGAYDGTIKTFTNNSNVFTAAPNLQAGGTDIDVGYYSRPIFEDIDYDGDLDLYVGKDDGTIKVFTNTGGVFTATADLQAGGSAIDVQHYSSPVFEDIDGDGDLDLYVGNSVGNITFFENTSGEVLVSSITIQGAGYVSHITTPGGTLQMSATVLPVNADDATCTWSVTNGTGSATIDANGLLTAATDGAVTVIATANDASGETASMVVQITNQSVGVNENNGLLSGVKTYPNPVQNQLFVELEQGQLSEMFVIDLSGKTVLSVTNSNTKSIDVSSLNQGIYILKIKTENGVATTRFIKK